MSKALEMRQAKLLELDPESSRAKALTALVEFRKSWTELGSWLTQIAYGGDYKDWGYDDFEVYCARELGLRKPTVKKLMVSYNYIKSHEQERLASGDAVPDYQTISELQRIRHRDDISEEEKERLHDAAFSGEADEKDLRREMRGMAQPQTIPGMEDDRAFADVLRKARTLRKNVMLCRRVPDGLQERIDQTLLELEALD